MKYLLLNFLLIIILLTGCENVINEIVDVQMGGCTMTICDGDPDFFMMGQSNANDELADAIILETGKTIHQINHGGQKIERWVNEPYKWISFDITFLDGRIPKGFIWMQGEANINSNENYEKYFNIIIDSFYHEKDFPVLILETINYNVDCSEIKSIHKRMCDNHDNWYFIETADCERKSDNVHLTENGQLKLAKRINDVINQNNIFGN